MRDDGRERECEDASRGRLGDGTHQIDARVGEVEKWLRHDFLAILKKRRPAAEY